MIGQTRVRKQIHTIIKGAELNASQIPSFCFCGPRGYGKTTIARVISDHLDYKFIEIIGGNITKPHHLAMPIFMNLPKQNKKGEWDKKGLIIFIDEIHSADPASLEILYPVIQDQKLNLIVGTPSKPEIANIALHNVLIIAATTNEELLPKPLIQRMVSINLDPYTNEELGEIIAQSSPNLSLEQVTELIPYTRGTPRNAVQFAHRCNEYEAVHGELHIGEVMAMNGIDENYLTVKEIMYLQTLAKMGGGPIGLSSISSILDLPKDQVSEMIERYLVQCGFIYRTPQGRALTEAGREVAENYGD